MKTFNRLIVVLVALALMTVSLIVLAASFGWLSPDRLPVGYWLQEGLGLATGSMRPERAPVQWIALGTLLLSIVLFWLEWRSARTWHRPIVVSSTPSGDVTLSREGIKHLVEHVATHTEGVLEATARVRGSSQLYVDCRARITPESNAPSVAKVLRETLKEAVERHVGCPVASVSVHTQLDPFVSGRRSRRVA